MRFAPLFIALLATSLSAVADGERAVVDEIVVSAQRRDQAAFDVPLSVSAFSEGELEQAGVDSLSDLAALAPSFDTFSGGPGSTYLQMRGISTIAGASTVGYYLDEAVMTSYTTFQPDAYTFDLQRIEVLRGPQGTLYGEGSMGGTLRLITNKPNPNDWESKTRLRYIDTHSGAPSAQIDSVLNIPLLEDSLGLRAIVGEEDSGGFIDEKPFQQVENANYVKRSVQRLSARYTPSDSSTVDLSQHRNTVHHGTGNRATAVYEIDNHIPVPSFDKVRVSNLTLQQDFDWMSVTATSSEYLRDYTKLADAREDAAALASLGSDATDVFTDGAVLAAVRAVKIDNSGTADYRNTDIRFSAAPDSLINWTAGYYQQNHHSTLHAVWSVIFNDGADQGGIDAIGGISEPDNGANNQDNGLLLNLNYITLSKAKAAYINADWALAERWSLGLGLRHFRETLTVLTRGTATGAPANGDYKQSVIANNPRIHLGWAPEIAGLDDSMFYLSAAKGFRSGGANAAQENDTSGIDPVYQPDEVWTYELGGRLKLFNGLVIPEVALYYNDWSNVQSYVATDLFPYIKNVGDADGFGIDIQLTAQPTSSLSLRTGIAWNDMKFVGNTADKNPGDPMDYVPRYSASQSITWTPPLNAGRNAFVRIDYSWRERTRYVYRLSGTDNYSDIVANLNLRLGIQKAGYEFALTGTNLTNFAGRQTPTKDEPEARGVRTRPRNIGLELIYNW